MSTQDSNISERLMVFQRFKRFKQRREDALQALYATYMHDLRPTEGFTPHSVDAIERAWTLWNDECEIFTQTCHHGPVKNRTFPKPPPEGDEYAPCRQMWACMIHQQTQETTEEHTSQVIFIREAVEKIKGSYACLSHPPTCPCKVPNNPWTDPESVADPECVAALEPLSLVPKAKCQGGGPEICSAEDDARNRVIRMMATEIVRAEQEVAEKPWLKVGECRCDAQYCAVSCSCLPGRVAEANANCAKMAAAAKAASIAATEANLAAAAEEAERVVTEMKASSNTSLGWKIELAHAKKDAKEARVAYAAQQAEKARVESVAAEAAAEAAWEAAAAPAPGAAAAAAAAAAVAVGAGLEAAKKGEPTPFLSLFRSRAPARAPAPAPEIESPYDYKHNVDSCPCGTCHKARVDSGTSDAYTARLTAASLSAITRLGHK